MIHGIGTDIVQVARMERVLCRYGDKFARRVLTPAELRDFGTNKRPAHFLARRFAAKEAVAKALGVGFGQGLSPRHIGVVHDKHGRPGLEYIARGAQLCAELGIGDSHISVSDEQDYAVAFAVLLVRR